MRVDVVGLKRYFGDTKAVDGITFSFSGGRTYAFVGPNGAGKTTTMRIMATLDMPTDGDVLYNGVSAVLYPEQARRVIGFVPDTLPTQPDTTVHEYLDFFARAYGLRGSDRAAAVEGIEEFTGVMPLREKLVTELSKGMKQRVSLGRALIHDPAVLILDEPAAGLDPRARVELRELLRLLAQRGKAILISSHILTELTELADGVVIIERGKLLETGGIQEVAERRGAGFAVAVRALGDMDRLHNMLLQMPFVEGVEPVDSELHVRIDGSAEQAAEILAALVRQDVRVCEFREIASDLEDIFMQVTQGEVQ